MFAGGTGGRLAVELTAVVELAGVEEADDFFNLASDVEEQERDC